jgi:hypothetical protein
VRRFWGVASCDHSTTPRLFGNTRSAVFNLHIRLFDGNPIWRVSHFDPAASLFKHHVRHHRIRTASRTSAVLVERIHKKAIEAFKRFGWMPDWANRTGHVHLIPGRGQTAGRFPLVQRILLTFCGSSGHAPTGSYQLLTAKRKRIHDGGELLAFTVRTAKNSSSVFCVLQAEALLERGRR